MKKAPVKGSFHASLTTTERLTWHTERAGGFRYRGELFEWQNDVIQFGVNRPSV